VELAPCGRVARFSARKPLLYRGSQARSRIDKLKKFRGMTGYDTIRQDTTANAARTLDSRYQLGFNLL